MVNYQCYRCGYITCDKTKITSHLNRKFICKPKINDIELTIYMDNILNGVSYDDFLKSQPKVSQKSAIGSAKSQPKVSQNIEYVDKKYSCKYCDKKYAHKQSLFKHLKICKEREKDEAVKDSMNKLVNLLNEELSEIRQEHRKEKEEYKNEIKKRDLQIVDLIQKAGISTINNITNNIQNNFKLLNYKDSDTSHLTENDYIKCLEHYNFCVPHIIRKIHFNPKKPENHNIYISNLKNSYIMIYMNNKWKVKNREEIISKIIDDKQVLLEKKIQEWVESGKRYPKIMAKFSRYIEKREENDVINAIKEDIKLLLYNSRNMILEKKLAKN